MIFLSCCKQLLERYPHLLDIVSLGEIATYLNISCRQFHRIRESISTDNSDNK